MKKMLFALIICGLVLVQPARSQDENDLANNDNGGNARVVKNVIPR